MSKVTLRSIAEASGLSPSGVSKALSAHPDMSQETIQRVNNLARKLNYQPSCFGTALKTGRTGILGFVGYEPQGISQRTYMPRLFDAVMNECHKRNLDLVIFDALGTWPHGNEQVPRVLARGLIDGAFLISAKPTDDPLLERLVERSVPLVIMHDVYNITANSIIIDIHRQGQIAVEHLRECGAKRVIYIETESERMVDFWAEMDGVVAEASKREGLEYVKEKVNTSWYDPAGRDDVRQHIRRLLTNRETFSTEPVGIIAINDTIAQYVLTVALEFGIRVPERLMVIGFSNDMFCELSSPPLSSFDYCTVMAPLAVEMLLERIEQGNKSLPSKTIIPKLIKRPSTVGG